MCPQIKPSEIFKRLNSKTRPVGQNKPDVSRKGLEIAGKVKAFTKKLEPEDPFKILVVD